MPDADTNLTQADTNLTQADINLIQLETDDLIAVLNANGYHVEQVCDASDGGSIVNVMRNGYYALTLTVTRTPGYDTVPLSAVSTA